MTVEFALRSADNGSAGLADAQTLASEVRRLARVADELAEARMVLRVLERKGRRALEGVDEP